MPAPHIVIQQVLLIGRFFHYALLTFVYARIQAISQLAVAVHAKRLDLRNKDAVRPPAAIRGSHGNSDYNLRWRYRETVVGGSSEYLEAVLQSHRRQRLRLQHRIHPCARKCTPDPVHSDAKVFL